MSVDVRNLVRMAFRPDGWPDRILRIAMVGILVVLVVTALVGTVLVPPRYAVDLEIPLRASERWLAGGQPYDAGAFVSPPGATQPFLYPPYTLPVFSILTLIPRDFLAAAWVALLALAAVLTCRRLAVPWIWMPLVLAWPPFAESIYGGNVQVLLFWIFVVLFWKRADEHRQPRRIESASEPAWLVGGASVAVGVIKVSQSVQWAFVLRHRPVAALAAAAVVAGLVAVTVPLTGIDVWFEWLTQLSRGSDPTWDPGGFALGRFLSSGIGLAVAAVCLVAAWFVPPRIAGPAIGILSVVGALSLHIFGLLFLLPAMLELRRELALMAAILIATYTYEGAWAGIAIVAIGYAAAQRWPILAEPMEGRSAHA